MSSVLPPAARPGRPPTRPGNALTDVAGVAVGHAQGASEGVLCGLTVVLPYPAATVRRRLYAGRWSLDGGGSMTGIQVVEDFGCLSSPVVLSPGAAVGTVYEGLVASGLRRDGGLSTAAGWPPLVLGLDDALWNPPAAVHAAVQRSHLEEAMAQASGNPVQQGSVGIGTGLCAFGLRGGVGSASRRVGGDLVVAVLVAANGGDRRAFRVAGAPLGEVLEPGPPAVPLPRSCAAVLATDAPLLPLQLDRLAGRAALGLARIGLLGPEERSGQVLAFSTTAIRREAGPEDAVEQAETVADAVLYDLAGAAAEAAEEAVLNALLCAQPAPDRTPPLASLETTNWRAALERWGAGR
ncbi:MAG: P1 family peptidase [Candidatus Latescibacterota bacterium]